VGVPFRIKICGITNLTDALLAAESGADAIGLNFYSQSPRYIDPETAGRIAKALPPNLDAVGIFVNQLLADMKALAGRAGIRSLQVYGDPAEIADPHPFRMVLASAVRDGDNMITISDRLERCRAQGWLPDAVLVDGHVPGSYGGTGVKAAWNLLADFRPGVPMILAGGLDPDNVADAIRIVQPYGVDVASGVERSPGKKDRDRMKRFIDNARTAREKLSSVN
jgi:phosphoribosylanthranilate isomerase